MVAKKRVAIVGAGVAGLVSIKSCLEEDGLEPTCFERHDKLGGLWSYSPELRPGQGAALYDSVVSNDSKEMMTFSDFPYPKENTPFMPHRMVLRHIQNYAEHFNLEKHIRFNTDVIDVQRNNDGKYWKLQIKDKDGKLSTEEFDYIMICTSVYNRAAIPSYPGMENFKGNKIHANEYREASKFKGKRVIVVGGSHSAGEISTEIARNGAESTDIYPAWKGTMLSDEMQDRLAQGHIKPMVEIEEFNGNDVIFKDGTTLENVNAVIFATGYEFAVPIIEDSWLMVPVGPNTEELAEMLGVKPSFWRLLLTDPKLAMAYKYGPMVPYWYRLVGPGAWPGARDRILNAIENTTYALKGYPSLREEK
ncbi:flavin-containing monooxygenase 2-like [Ptychodera flava]|uniref:flavin-containing monooxygenase 2-like n=1 Tax=Ptychodera flava TaxID=63121 RepID=UPI003969D650